MNQWHKGIARREVGNTLYLSVPFTWLLEEAEQMEVEWKGKSGKRVVLKGGPAYQVPSVCDGFEPILWHNPLATFTTRGCPNKCEFCIVGKLEPEFVEISNFRPAPMVCDNNFLYASINHIDRVIHSLKKYPMIDFQGIDANFVTPEKSDLLGKVKCKVHIGLDRRNEAKVYDAVKLLQQRSTKEIICYVLINHKETPEEALYRLDLVRTWGCLPFAMRYQPLGTKKINTYISPQWQGHEKELKKMVRYYNKLNWLGHIPYEEYQETEQIGFDVLKGE